MWAPGMRAHWRNFAADAGQLLRTDLTTPGSVALLRTDLTTPGSVALYLRSECADPCSASKLTQRDYVLKDAGVFVLALDSGILDAL